MSSGDVLKRLEGRYMRFEVFVNEDVLNLLGALAALVVRYRETDLTEDERAHEGSKNAVLWAVERGQQRATQHMLVSLWAAFEAYVEDLWIEAARQVTIDRTSALGKVKASIIELHELPEAEHFRKLWEQVETRKKYGIDRYCAVFEMIGAKVSVRNIEALKQTVPVTSTRVPADDQWTLRRSVSSRQSGTSSSTGEASSMSALPRRTRADGAPEMMSKCQTVCWSTTA